MTTLEKLEEVKKLLGEISDECKTTGEQVWPATTDDNWVGRDLLYVSKHIKVNLLCHQGIIDHYIETVKKHPLS